MAIVWTQLKPANREADEDRGDDGRTVRTYRRVYQVLSNSSADDEAYILANADIPSIGSVHPSNSAAVLRKRSAKESTEGNKPLWEITCEYSQDKKRNGTRPYYPYTPARISCTTERKEVPVVRDLNNKPAKNTAGDLIADPSLIEDRPIFIRNISVGLSASNFSEGWLAQYFNAVNSSNYRGWPKGCAYVMDMNYSEEYYTTDSGVDELYYQVNIKIGFDEFGWQPTTLSQGFRELYTEQGETKKRIVRINGEPASSPVPLDANGRALLGEENVDNAKYLEFKTKRYVSFADIDF